MADHGEFIGYQDGLLWALGADASTIGNRYPVPCRVCTRCGAVVADEELHDVWHDRLGG